MVSRNVRQFWVIFRSYCLDLSPRSCFKFRCVKTGNFTFSTDTQNVLNMIMKFICLSLTFAFYRNVQIMPTWINLHFLKSVFFLWYMCALRITLKGFHNLWKIFLKLKKIKLKETSLCFSKILRCFIRVTLSRPRWANYRRRKHFFA